MVPHLITALNGPINELEARVLESMPATERWFRLEWMEHTPTFYASVDLRNAGFKLAPVDTNLFPGGFNHLTAQMLPQAVQAAMAAIEKICPEARNLLVIPETGARCSFYLDNLATLARIFTQAGLNVRFGTLDTAITEPTEMPLANGERITLEPLVRKRGRLMLKGFDPCTILLNNDLAAGTPPQLMGLHEQYLLPPLHAGWTVRRKSQHFRAYDEVAKRFGKLLGMDPWLITPMFQSVDLNGKSGLEALQTAADAQLTKVRRKYKEYGINEKPFVIIKSDVGSYGRGVLTVRDAKDIESLATSLPENIGHEIIVQEGVPTHERVHEAVAEPVVYTMDRYVVGGYYRVHAHRGIDENLNAPGASYVPLAFAESPHLPRPGEKPGVSAPNRFYMYGVIGRLAMLAASYELEATDPQAEAEAA
ncbi:glutamate--cysteine ligase [Roseateles puraquae]|jgi:glutamate--cysteine ligase|uniref:Glutamate--cysteine ligase n=1 Tax=Roseateles puraquae TaxID=431059 RepID=A0A254N1U5_9BURK|nr:glutamate--cysteine ligase [Roseateles puraquae]MDG0853067.1 glutamate--cysteine ligase [Roseateles puraquae]OWR02186.1 glutamate--cysteine ligase [Roseateles puraquae]